MSVRPSNVFMREQHPKCPSNRVASACGYLNSQRSALSQAERTVAVGRHRIACAADGDGGDGCVCVHVCALVRVCTRDVFAIYDNIFDPG